MGRRYKTLEEACESNSSIKTAVDLLRSEGFAVADEPVESLD